MLGLDVLFWMLVILFAFIGSIRGWAKELLVLFASILSLFILKIISIFFPFIQQVLTANSASAVFVFRTVIFLVIVFFGYQSPNIGKLAASGRFARDRLQDILFGFVLGAVNGFMIAGCLWYFLDQAQYPFASITAPAASLKPLLDALPPVWLTDPLLYFVVALAFAFVLVVLI
jgi:uncharacterized membrane protein required for colicin V production